MDTLSYFNSSQCIRLSQNETVSPPPIDSISPTMRCHLQGDKVNYTYVAKGI